MALIAEAAIGLWEALQERVPPENMWRIQLRIAALMIGQQAYGTVRPLDEVFAELRRYVVEFDELAALARAERSGVD